MSDLDRLLAQYKQAHQTSGEADPRPFLEQLSGVDRAALAALIDEYLTRSPRRELEPAAFRDSPAATVAEGLQRSLAGTGGLWPSVLPRLRTQAQLRRSELVAELAARLGAQSQQEKVASYYHEMEQGLLPASGVSDTVLDALGKIVGWSREALRRAGEIPAPGGPGGTGAEPGAVFARRARLEEHAEPAGFAAPAARAEPPAQEWDEVDRLFRGGG
jgi:hypothetical protein